MSKMGRNTLYALLSMVVVLAVTFLSVWPSSPVSAQFVASGSGAGGDASGPAASLNNEISLFSGAGGKTLKQSTVTLDPATGKIVRTGNLEIENVGTLTLDMTGDFALTGPAGDLLAMGEAGGIDVIADAGTALNLGSGTTNLEVGPTALRQVPLVSPPMAAASCNGGEFYYDTSGAFCGCDHVADAWVVLGGAGTCA